jgi:hypothetical protein
MLVRLQNYPLGNVVHDGYNCQCGTCDQSLITTPYHNNSGIPGYNYGGVNLLRLSRHAGDPCVSKVVLTFEYSAGNNTEIPYEPTCEEGCGNHGTCVVNHEAMSAACECDEDFYGPTCQCYVPSHMLKTDHPPVLDTTNSGFLAKVKIKLNGKGFTI